MIVTRFPDLEIYQRDAMAHGVTLEQYMNIGRQALEIINFSRQIAKMGSTLPRVIIDYPCGAGRVNRWLRAEFPEAEIIASDLSRHEMDWCCKKYTCTSVEASQNFEEIKMPKPADLIWCGSLLTHLSERKSNELLNTMVAWLKPSGIAVATTHGRHRMAHLFNNSASGVSKHAEELVLSNYKFKGYGYAEYKQGLGYGFSMTRLSWIGDWIETNPQIKAVMISEGLWAGRQDVIAFQKSQKPFVTV